MDKWIGKIAVVTGASAGIGAAVAKSLAAKGMIVVGLARRVEKIEELSQSSEGKIFVHKCDVTDLKSIREAFKWIEEKFGVINVLINNAGKLVCAKFTDEDDEIAEKLNDVINTNFTGLVQCARETLKLMTKSKDSCMIINMSSISDFVLPFTLPANNVYPPTKHAVRAFSEVLRQELITTGNDKIRVVNLSPGIVRTELFLAANEFKELPPNIKALTALDSEDVAECILYLLSTPTHVNVTQLTIKPIGEKI